jgi:tetratricopeptide (TPR) repeat protein
MPYVPKFKHLFKILCRVPDKEAAEGLWYQGLLLSEEGDDESALLAFSHSRLLDRSFGGAYYNYAALTEKKHGRGPQALKAWLEYVVVAESDPRQARETVVKVKGHIADLQRMDEKREKHKA